MKMTKARRKMTVVIRRPWTGAELSRFIVDYDSGLSLTELSAKYDRTLAALHSQITLLRKQGKIKTRRRRVTPRSDVDTLILQLHSLITSAGYSVHFAAYEAEICPEVVRRWFATGQEPRLFAFIKVLRAVGFDLAIVPFEPQDEEVS